MEMDYTYFEADEGGYIGYFTDFPQHETEAETIEEPEEMLLDLYECLNLAKYHKRKHTDFGQIPIKNQALWWKAQCFRSHTQTAVPLCAL